jgi:hypothetical protein
MPVPLVGAAAAAAARAIAKKLATRNVGGITGKGSKNVNPVYKNVGEPKSAVKVKPQGYKGAVATGRDLDKIKAQNHKPSAKYAKEYTDAMNKMTGR